MTEKPQVKSVTQHLGYKYLFLLLGLVLTIIWVVYNFIGWLSGIGTAQIATFLYGLLAILITILFGFLIHFIWRFFHEIPSTTIPPTAFTIPLKHWKLNVLSLIYVPLHR